MLMLEGRLTSDKGRQFGEPGWKWADTPLQVLQAQTWEKVAQRPHSPSPQAAFRGHPAGPDTVMA